MKAEQVPSTIVFRKAWQGLDLQIVIEVGFVSDHHQVFRVVGNGDALNTDTHLNL